MTKDEHISLLQAENVALKAENAKLSLKILSLEEKIMYLFKLLANQGIKKDSHNSHNSPSQDKSKPKRRTSLRKKSTRKSGGQKGHKGHHLEMTSNPDKILDLKSDFCQSCGNDLQGLSQEFLAKRQEIILPPVQPVYVEYRQFGVLCSCGHHQKAAFPKNIKAPIQFGSDVIALVAYLNVFQYLPYARLKLLFKDIFNLSLSEGSIENLLNKAAKAANPIYEGIFEEIKNASYLGSDETGAKVNGEKWWIWVWQNTKNTFIKASKSRGFAIIEALFPDGLLKATIGSDRWAAQLKIKSNNKQLCFPHLLRDLNFLIETEKNSWAIHFKDLLKEALNLRDFAKERGISFQNGDFKSYKLEHRLNRLLARIIDKNECKSTFAFQKSMIKNRNYLFPFLYNLEIPPDNNASERAIRNVKVKQKISGQFKSGQDTFCTLRSIVDTLRKRELDVLFFLKQIIAA